MGRLPERIVCLSAESADWLWRLGAWEKVVGVTAYFVAPPEAPPKRRVSGFSSGRIEEIVALQPDLVITFSDVQAALAADLIRRGLSVLSTNQRTLQEVEDTLALLGRVIGRETEANQLLDEFQERLRPVISEKRRPRVCQLSEVPKRPCMITKGWPSPSVRKCSFIVALLNLNAFGCAGRSG